MDESEDNMSAEDIKAIESPFLSKSKPKKRSQVDRELETSLTSKITSPALSSDGLNTSRYGRALRPKSEKETLDTKRRTSELKSPLSEKSPLRNESPVYKMHASNSPIRKDSAKKNGPDTFLDNQIESIYQENISLSRFSSEENKLVTSSPAKKYPKVYIRKDLLQNKEPEETIPLIKNMYSPVKSEYKSTNSHLNNILERSSERYSLGSSKSQNGYIDNSSVVKALDFDSKKKRKDNKILSKGDLFEMEAKCPYQVGDLAWARMGTYPFWPCIVTRDPSSGVFIKKKLFGRVERDIIHVTFFGDNGRRGWIVDSMLRKYLGQLEFENARDNFTPENKKKDPKLYAAFFVSEKKQALWNTSVEEAEMLLREPKRLRIDIFNDMLLKSRARPKQTKSGKISRTDSDVSLSESLYDSLFSEDDNKADGNDRSRNRSKNKSLDVFEVVTACLDNMAAKTGITKIQRQSHMDIWLQKAKSKTPEKLQVISQISSRRANEIKTEQKVKKCSNKNKKTSSQVPKKTSYTLRKSTNESDNLISHQHEKDYSKYTNGNENVATDFDHTSLEDESICFAFPESNGLGVITKVESLNDKVKTEPDILRTNNESIPLNNSMDSSVNGSFDSELENTEGNNSSSMANIKISEIKSTPKNAKKKAQYESQRYSGRLRTKQSRKNKKQKEDNTFEMKEDENPLENSRFLQYLELRQDSLIDENPELSHEEIVAYLYKTWLYEVSPRSKSVAYHHECDENETSSVTEIDESQSTNEPETQSDSIETPYIGPKSDVTESSEKEKFTEDTTTDIDDSTMDTSTNIEPISIDPNETCDEDSQDSQTSTKEDNPAQISTNNIENMNDKDTSHSHENQLINEQDMEANNDINGYEKKSKDMSIGDDYCSSDSESLPYSDLTDPGDRLNLKEDFLEENIAKVELKDDVDTDNNSSAKDNAESPTFTQRDSPTYTQRDSPTFTQIEDNPIHPIQRGNLESPTFTQTESPTFTQTESPTFSESENEICNEKGVFVNHIIAEKTDSQTSSISPDDINPIFTPKENVGSSTEQHIEMNKEDFMDVDTNDNITENIVDSEYKGNKKDGKKANSLSLNYKHEKAGLKSVSKSNKNRNKPMFPTNEVVDREIDLNNDAIIGKGPIMSKVKEVNVSPSKEVHIPNCITEEVKENGYHHDHEMNGVDFDTISNHSEDSVISSKSENKRKLRSKQNKNNENPLDNVEFVKYLEIRQDALMDENPELNQEEIVAYLYKTWLYEESAKSDEKKNDDLRQATLVKGLSKSPMPKKSLSLAKNNMLKFLQTNKNVEQKENSDQSLFFNKNKVLNEDEKHSEVSSDENISEESNEIIKPLEKELSMDLKKTANDSLQNNFKDTSSIMVNLQNEKDNNTSTLDTPNLANLDDEESGPSCKDDYDGDSIHSEDSETPLIKCKLRSKSRKENCFKEMSDKITEEDTISINSTESDMSLSKRKKKGSKREISMEDPEFLKYVELRQDAVMDDHPELSQDEIISYLYKTWLYEENNKSELKKNDEIEQSTLVKGLKDATHLPKKVRRSKVKIEKGVEEETLPKDKPKRKSIKPFYNEEYSDIEDELEVFEIFKKKPSNDVKDTTKVDIKTEPEHNKVPQTQEPYEEIQEVDEIDLYFAELCKPKPNIFKGLAREKVCEICEKTHTLVKCKGCNGMFHVDCVKKELDKVEEPAPSRGRKKKKKAGRKPKNFDEYDSQDDKSQDVSEENNDSIEEILEAERHTVDAETFEAKLEAKMKELLETTDNIDYGDITSEDELDWDDTVPGKCEIIDIKLKPIQSTNQIDHSDFKCNNCTKYDAPICFVCKNAVSKTQNSVRQKCHVPHCHKYYHLECLDHWPQSQFNGGAPSKNNKKVSEHFETLTCPRHVCHTCVSDDPRGCKTRFSGDKLAKCVRCPATYHSFTKCVPAGTLILSASHIICPRHVEHRSGKVPCHVNTGWCFICALGGSLICCEYCPTSFHAECLNIKPPEGGYMCEDCETGRLPLYGEMVWVKLGHYRWWPGVILHPSEIPENILAVKHGMGEFVVRFFGQYDYYWVNRGRVFPFQEGDSGRISSQKSKIDAAFTTAMEHAQRACQVLKNARPNEEESLDIAMSLLPPHYVKLKVNKPCGALGARRVDDPESSLTQCDCNPHEEDVCGPYSQCLNRMLLTECGPTCRAGDRCNNRAFEKRQYPKLAPYRTPSRGWGLKTLEDIKAGQFVIEYVGELIDEEEFRRRMRRKHEIRDENFYFLTLDKERMIDAGPKGNLARFMNHCCEPNCETQKWTVLGDVRVGLFALYDIPANSEVTFNYNLECAGIDKKRCMCGAKRCSGYIGAKPKQEESQPKKIKTPNAKRTYKKRKPEESPSTKNKPKRPLGRPPKPRELTEIEKDLLIIRNATNNLSSDESTKSIISESEKNPKALKRKRVSFSSEDPSVFDGETPNVKRSRLEEKCDVGD